MKKRKSPLLLILLCSICFSAFSQEEEGLPRHALAFYQGISFIPNSVEEIGNAPENLTKRVQSLGLAYKYRFSHRWLFGAAWDFQVDNFKINHEGTEIERENVAVVVATANYEALKNLELFIGPGYEFEKNQNFFVIKAGIEYGLFIANDWWIIPEVSFEFKEKYVNWNVGFKLQKAFGPQLHHEEEGHE